MQCSINDTSGGDNTHGGTGAVNDGSWRFCLLSFNTALPSKQIKMYIDGALDSEFDDSSPNILITSSHLFLGCLAPDDGYNQKYTGLLDDVRVYSRALGTTEISDLYHEGGWATGAPSTDFHFLGFYGGHKYRVSNGTANWQDAKTACEAVGGHLVTIAGPEANDMVMSATRFNWAGGEPNDYFNEDYVSFNTDGGCGTPTERVY